MREAPPRDPTPDSHVMHVYVLARRNRLGSKTNDIAVAVNRLSWRDRASGEFVTGRNRSGYQYCYVLHLNRLAWRQSYARDRDVVV